MLDTAAGPNNGSSGLLYGNFNDFVDIKMAKTTFKIIIFPSKIPSGRFYSENYCKIFAAGNL